MRFAFALRPCISICAALACSAASVIAWAQADATHRVPVFPSASDDVRQGFVRVVNRSGHSGDVSIVAVDDAGTAYGPLTLALDGRRTMHFNSDDLENGNAAKGLSGGTGAGDGDWRLELTSTLDLEVLAYIRTADGFLTAMHDVAPVSGNRHRVAIFNPGSNANQVSRLRLVNPAETAAEVTITGKDDRGKSPGGAVRATVPAGASRTLTAAELEDGGASLTGALGDGAGKWRLEVVSEQPIRVLSLLSSPTGHLTNLSTAPSNAVDGVHAVLVFPSAADASGRQGFVRVINQSNGTAVIAIRARDDSAREYGPLTLTVPGGEAIHFNSDDLEDGNDAKGLSGGTGAGQGDWRLELSSDADIDVLAYIRTTDGFLTAMHDVVPASQGRHRVAIFNPGSNTAQRSSLRVVNTGDAPAAVDIVGTDDRGESPGSRVQATVPAGAARTYTAQALESGSTDFEGALGDGAGKWRLDVDADRSVRVLSLLSSPTGHLTNLSTATAPDDEDGRAEEAFRGGISAIVQSKCVNCHVAGGDSGNTRLVFVPDSDPDHLATNYQVFAAFVDAADDGADLVLDKIRGIDHGGGEQVAEDTEEYATMERFLELLAGEKVGLRVRMFGEGTVEVVDGGELACDGRVCSDRVRTGRRVTLRATAAQGYAFDGWRSCDRVAGNDCVVRVARERLVFADFLSSEPLELEDDVVVFDRVRLADVEEYDPESGLMILRPDAKLDDIEIGSVLASWVITDDLGFESYFLRRVTDLRHPAGSPAFLRTTHATLDDLIESGSLSLSRSLGPDQVASYELPAGVTPLSHPGAAMTVTELQNGRKLFAVARPKGGRTPAALPKAAPTGRECLDFDFEHLEIDAVRGNIELCLSYDFLLEFTKKKKKVLFVEVSIPTGVREVQAKVGIEPSITLKTRGDKEVEKDLPLKFTFAPITFGPVVLVPEITSKLVLTVGGAASFKPELTLTVVADAGLAYREGEWERIWNWDRYASLDPEGADKRTIGVSAKARASVDFSTKLWRVAGPYVGLGPHVRGEIVGSLSERCEWNYGLYAGATADFGVDVKILGFGITKGYDFTIAEFPIEENRGSCPDAAVLDPLVPDNLHASRDGLDAIDVSWDRWSYGGSQPVGYEVQYGVPADRGIAWRTGAKTTGRSYRHEGIRPNRRYCFRVQTLVADRKSGFGRSKCINTPQDEVQPSTPEGVFARALSPSVISLTWEASTDDWGVGRYLVWEPNEEGYGRGITRDLSYNITELNSNTEYCFGVQAADTAGNTSETSGQACATTLHEPNWRFRAACTGDDDYQVEHRFHLDEEHGGALVSVDDTQKDYDDVPAVHALTGSYNQHEYLLDGKVFWWFAGAPGVRTDTFSANLSSGDTGDLTTEKGGPGAGCDLVVRFTRLDGSEGAATPPAAKKPFTAPLPDGQETIRRRR